MVTIIKITYPDSLMKENRLRTEARKRFEIYDRVPTMAWIDPRFTLHQRGFTFRDFYESPKAHAYHQLMNAKWEAENIPDDRVTGLDPDVPSPGWWVKPYWSLKIGVVWSTLTAGAFGAKEELGDPLCPPKDLPLIHSPEDVDKLELPECDENRFGKTLEWYYEICKLVKEDFEVYFNGKKVDVQIGLPWLEQFTAAIDLVGSDFYMWLYKYPDVCHRLLRKITEVCVKWSRCVKDVTGEQINVGGDGDAPGNLSLTLFKKFALPYLEQLYSLTPNDRPFHCDNRIPHLLECIIKDLRITYFHGVGYQLDPKILREKIEESGRKICLTGNVNPILMYSGTREQVMDAAKYCLENLAPLGGLLLCDGCNIPPGTPLENIEALRIASEKYGRGPP